MRANIEDRPVYLRRWPAGQLSIAAFGVVFIAVALGLMAGIATRGLTFLGELALYSGVIIIALAVSAILLALGSISIAAKRSASPSELIEGYRYPAGLRVLVVTAAGLYIASVLALMFGVLRFDIINADAPDPDQLGVAVAEFTTHSSTSSVSGSRLSAFVARGLRQQISARPDLTDQVTILSAPSINSDREARDYAAKNGVQLVIWGEVAETAENAFTPFVTLVEPQMHQAWYGELPAWQPVALTGGESVGLGTTLASHASGLTKYVMGLIDLNRRNYSQAAYALQQAVQLSVSDSGVMESGQEERFAGVSLAHFYLALGRTYEAMGDTSRARDEYLSSLQQDPSQVAAHLGLGNIDYIQRDCKKAREAYGRALRAKPSLAVAWYSRGNAQFCLKEYVDAASDYREALRLSQQGGETVDLYHLVLGITLCRTGSTEEGIDLLNRASHGGISRLAMTESKNCTALEEIAKDTLERTPMARTPERPTPAPTAVQPETTTPALAAAAYTQTPSRIEALIGRLWMVLLWTPTPTATASAPTAIPTGTPSSTGTGSSRPTATSSVTATPTRPSLPTEAPSPTELPLSSSPTKGPNASWTQFPPTAVLTPEPVPTSTSQPPQPTATPAPTWTPIPSPPASTRTATPLPPTSPPATATRTSQPNPTALPPTAAPTGTPLPAATPLAPTQQPPAPTIPVEPSPTLAPLPTEAPQPPTSTPENDERPPRPPRPTRRP